MCCLGVNGLSQFLLMSLIIQIAKPNTITIAIDISFQEGAYAPILLSAILARRIFSHALEAIEPLGWAA